MSYYIHQTPGRLRVRTPAIKHCAHKALSVEGLFGGIEGVTLARCNHVTGSITIHYDVRKMTPALLINRMAAMELLKGIVGFPGPLPFVSSARPSLRGEESFASATLSPEVKRLLWASAKICLPFLVERALGKPARILVAAFL